jgi:hypothetical protein
MDRYVSLGDFSLQRTLNLACSILESNGVPTLVQHLCASSSNNIFRLLVPDESFHASGRMLVGLLSEAGWCPAMTLGPREYAHGAAA